MSAMVVNCKPEFSCIGKRGREIFNKSIYDLVEERGYWNYLANQLL